MKLKINGCTLLLTSSVQSRLDHLFSSLFKPYFIHTFIHHGYLISLLERNLFGVSLQNGQCAQMQGTKYN